MNSNQLEMISVKSAIERTLNGFAVSHLNDNDVTPQQRVNNFFADVERYVAMLFVSGQITNNYLVRSTDRGIEVSFVARGQYSCVNYMLPEDLRWTVRKMIPRKVEVETIAYKQAWTQSNRHQEIFTDPHDRHVDGSEYLEFEAAHNGREDALGHLTRAEEDEYAQVVLGGAKWSVLPDEANNI